MHRSAHGFTLLEMLVVLTIVALIAAFVMPYAFHPNARAELQSSAQGLGAALQRTRSRAIVGNRETSFIVDVGNALYRPTRSAAPVTLPHGIRVALFSAADQELSETVGSIRFYPDGSSSGGAVALMLDGQRFDVMVDWLTGGVSIHEPAATAAQ